MERPNHKCDLCDKNFKSSKNLKSHIMCVHHKIKNHKCDLCDKTYSKKSDLKKHKQVVHEEINNYKCDSFEKSFSESNMQNPVADNLIMKPVAILPEPSFAITEPTVLNDELKSCPTPATMNFTTSEPIIKSGVHHTKIKNQKCDLCNKTYFKKIDLKKHKQFVHEGLKNFKCDLCDKFLIDKSSLKRHISNLHNRLKSHKCDKSAHTEQKPNSNMQKIVTEKPSNMSSLMADATLTNLPNTILSETFLAITDPSVSKVEIKSSPTSPINVTSTTDNKTNVTDIESDITTSVEPSVKHEPIITYVNAHLIQTSQGPRIALQDMKDVNFTNEQIFYIKQNVFNQLLILQAEAQKQGKVPPTKITIPIPDSIPVNSNRKVYLMDPMVCKELYGNEHSHKSLTVQNTASIEKLPLTSTEKSDLYEIIYDIQYNETEKWLANLVIN